MGNKYTLPRTEHLGDIRGCLRSHCFNRELSILLDCSQLAKVFKSPLLYIASSGSKTLLLHPQWLLSMSAKMLLSSYRLQWLHGEELRRTDVKCSTFWQNISSNNRYLTKKENGKTGAASWGLLLPSVLRTWLTLTSRGQLDSLPDFLFFPPCAARLLLQAGADSPEQNSIWWCVDNEGEASNSYRERFNSCSTLFSHQFCGLGQVPLPLLNSVSKSVKWRVWMDEL